jgi:arginyl-tRNA synthetase
MQEQIFQAVKEALAELGAPEVDFVVERPGDLANGDYATNAALVASKKVGKSPKELAQELREKLLSEKSSGRLSAESSAVGFQTFSQEVFHSVIEKIEIAGPGFINFYLAKEAVAKEIADAATKDDWANNDVYANKTVMVEYTQPNPFKEFHIGHLMSNTLGESVCRLLERARAKVIRVNYQGDVGPHVAKAMHVLLERGEMQPTIEQISNAYVEGARRYEEDPKEKEAIDTLNKLIYQQYEAVTDKKIWDLYTFGRKVTLEHFEELYAVLGTQFDHYFFESDTGVRGLAMVRSHTDVFTESEGAIVFHGEDYGLHTRVFINRLGLPTYETKDLGLAELKKEYAPFDISITTTAKEQDEYFKVVFKALEQIHPDWAGQFKHVSHGMMRFASGKMSSRKGNVITGESLLNDLTEASKEKMQGRELKDANKTAQQVAVGAIKFAVLKQGSGKDIVFDPEKSLSLEGDSGPYLQYALTRARSLLRKAEATGKGLAESDADASPRSPAAEAGDSAGPHESLERSESVALPLERSSLERTLIHFPEVVARAARELEPHYVTTFLTELASLFNSWYAAERVIGSPEQEYGILLTKAFEQTMQNGLTLLGIPAPEEM